MIVRDYTKTSGNLSIISLDQSERWDSLVKSFKDYDIFYLSSYVKAFKIHGDGEPILFYYKNKEFQALNVVMKRDISLDSKFISKIPPNTYYDITTSYGYGGFLLEGTITEDGLNSLNREYISKCLNDGIVSEFVRFHPVINNAEKVDGIYDITTLGKTITVDLSTHDKIWGNFHSKNRNMIRKAKKSGVQIYWGRGPELFETFEQMYRLTMDKDQAKDYYYFEQDFFNSILNDLKYNSIIFYAKHETEIIAMSIILHSNNNLHYHLSTSNRKYQNLAPTNLLLYEVACWGSENGYKKLHLGGGLGSSEDNLYKFKKVFNINSESTFKIGKKIFDNEKYTKLVSLRNIKEDNGNSYFPLYRS